MSEDVEIVPADRPGAWLVRAGGHDQSLVDLEDPTHLGFDYVRRMGDVLDDLRPGPLRVLHVGGAGLTLPRYVAATRPGSGQVVLEPDAGLTALVRERLPLPRRSGIRVRPVDGATGVRDLRDDAFDVVVLDAYAEGEVPAALTTSTFLGEAGRVLVPGGVALVNLADRAPFARGRDTVAALRAVLPIVVAAAEPATLRGRRPGNLLLVGSAEEAVGAALARRAVQGAAPYRVLDARAVSDTLGGGTARTS